MRNTQPNSYASFQRALDLLDFFSNDHAEWSISELALRSGLHKSTVSRLAKMFEIGGFLERSNVTRKYRLGLHIYELASSYRAADSFYQLAAGVVRTLSQKTGHTAYLSVLNGTDLVVLDAAWGSSPLQVVVAPGQRTPAHASAGGKALLATFSDGRISQLYAKGLEKFTPATKATLKELLAELNSVRQRGYAVANSEWKPSVYAIGIALTDAHAARHASLALAFPAYPLPTRKDVETLAQLLIQETAELRTSMRRATERPVTGHIGRDEPFSVATSPILGLGGGHRPMGRMNRSKRRRA